MHYFFFFLFSPGTPGSLIFMQKLAKWPGFLGKYGWTHKYCQRIGFQFTFHFPEVHKEKLGDTMLSLHEIFEIKVKQ